MITRLRDRRSPREGRRRGPGFDPRRRLDLKEIRRTDRFVHYGVSSAALAWDDAGQPEVPSERAGVIFATGIGGIETLIAQHLVLPRKGPGRVSPFMVPALMANARERPHRDAVRSHRPELRARSPPAPRRTTRSARRCDYIRDGYMDLCVAGGSEAATLPLTVAAFAQMTALTKNPDPETASRPFDKATGRVRALRGRLHADPRVRDAREGPGRPRLLRGRGVRRLRRRLPHHGPRSEGFGRGPRDGLGPARRRRGA